MRCPEGKTSVRWAVGTDGGHPFVRVGFSDNDWGFCESRPSCTPAGRPRGGRLGFPRRQTYEALRATQAWYASSEGRRQYARRVGVEGTLSQGVRAFGMRRSRYRGLDKTHLQNVAIASAINLDHVVAWLDGRPRALTRTSRLAIWAPLAQQAPEKRPQRGRQQYPSVFRKEGDCSVDGDNSSDGTRWIPSVIPNEVSPSQII